jgi:FimV-like protein
MHDDTNEAGTQNGKPGSLEQAGSVSVSQPQAPLTVDAKLEQIMELCEIGDFDRARPLLYDVLTEGEESQVEVAKGILAQLDA